MLLQPSAYERTPIAELLRAAGDGIVGLDQRWVRSILNRPEEAATAILAYGIHPPEESRVQIDIDLLNLLTQLPAADPVDYICALLREGLTEIPDNLLFLARRSGTRIVEPLLEVYRGLEEEDAGEVSFLLAALGVRDQRLLDVFVERLEFDMEDGAILLGLYGDPAGIPHLERFSAEVGKNREVDFALEQLRHPGQMPTEETAMDFLADYPAEALPEFDALTDEEILAVALTHEDKPARLAALDILEDLDTENTLEPDGVIALAQSEEAIELRASAFRVLARMKRYKRAQEAAESALRNPALEPALRAAALIALLPGGLKPAEIQAFIEQFLAIPAARPDAVQAMWRSELGVYRARFGDLLNDSDLAVRRQAVRGAGVTGDVTAVGKLRPLLRDADLREDALFAYSMALPSDVSPSRMRSLFTRIEKDAGGLDGEEARQVGMALDMRLMAAGKPPVFFPDDEDEDDQ
jgi:hypothetical protein